MENQEEKRNIALVLSGGGIRSAAQVGFLKLFEEKGLHINAVAGASAGAVVGALYAKGVEVEKILSFLKNTELFSFSNYAFGKPGFINSEKFIPVFQEYFKEDSFDTGYEEAREHWPEIKKN